MNRNQLYFLGKAVNFASWLMLVIGLIVCLLLLPWWTLLIPVVLFLVGIIFYGHLETLANNKTDPDELIFNDKASAKTDKKECVGKKGDDMIFDE